MGQKVFFYCTPGSTEHYFFIENVYDEMELQSLYRLRYQVFCEERELIPKADYPDRLESDTYDENSTHFAAYRIDGELAGTLRLVMPRQLDELPVFKYCKIDKKTLPPDLTAENSAEISRLAISKTLRRRTNDGDYAAIPDSRIEIQQKGQRRRVCPELVLGLYKAMYHETKRRKIKYWFAAMEPSLEKLLSRFQFCFDTIGPETDYYGLVKPYLAKVETIESAVIEHDNQIFKRFTEGL